MLPALGQPELHSEFQGSLGYNVRLKKTMGEKYLLF